GRGFAAGCLPLRFRDLGACLRDGAAANLGELREVGRRGVGIGLERCERPIARFAGRATPVFALAPPAPRSLARSGREGCGSKTAGGVSAVRSSGASAPRTAAAVLGCRLRALRLARISVRSEAGSMENLLGRECAR